jgi:hypothetical protein
MILLFKNCFSEISDVIYFVLSIPDHNVVPFNVSNAVFFVIEALDLKQRDLDGPHVLVDDSDLELRLVFWTCPQYLVNHCLGRPQFPLLDGLELILGWTLDDESVVFEG